MLLNSKNTELMIFVDKDWLFINVEKDLCILLLIIEIKKQQLMYISKLQECTNNALKKILALARWLINLSHKLVTSIYYHDVKGEKLWIV